MERGAVLNGFHKHVLMKWDGEKRIITQAFRMLNLNLLPCRKHFFEIDKIFSLRFP